MVFLLKRLSSCRWRRAGITLSELQADYPSFLAALLESLKANNEPMFDAAVTVLADLVREVDVLPARESAIRTVLTGTLAARAHLNSQPNMDENSKHRHAYGLCSLAAAIGSAEAAFLSKGGSEALALVEWLVNATAGGAGELGFDGAALALEAWPKLEAVPRSKRVPQFQVPLFEAIFQVRACVYCPILGLRMCRASSLSVSPLCLLLLLVPERSRTRTGIPPGTENSHFRPVQSC
jgi:hypothetical protein